MSYHFLDIKTVNYLQTTDVMQCEIIINSFIASLLQYTKYIEIINPFGYYTRQIFMTYSEDMPPLGPQYLDRQNRDVSKFLSKV